MLDILHEYITNIISSHCNCSSTNKRDVFIQNLFLLFFDSLHSIILLRILLRCLRLELILLSAKLFSCASLNLLLSTKLILHCWELILLRLLLLLKITHNVLLLRLWKLPSYHLLKLRLLTSCCLLLLSSFLFWFWLFCLGRLSLHNTFIKIKFLCCRCLYEVLLW